jgi:acetyl esterase/lipase
MHIKPKNIYVCGDSAGGNLSCSLTALVMKNGLLKPKGLFLAYPCVDTRMIYYPSRKYIINDPLLWPSIALMFFNSYTNEKQRDDPIASPLLLSEEYISGAKGDKRFPLAWPRTYITLGSKDFLRD